MSPALLDRPRTARPPAAPARFADSSGDGRRRIPMTREEWAAFCETTERKYEWANGEAIEMPNVTKQHSKLTVSLSGMLWSLLRTRGRSDVEVDHADLCVRTRGGDGANRFADLTVTVGPQRFHPHPRGRELELLNPTVVVEVLSESTAEEDETGEKFEDYTATPSVTDYVVVDSRAVRVRHRSRTGPDAAWRDVTRTGPADALELPALEFRATLAEIYDGVNVG